MSKIREIYEENQHLKRMPPMLSDIAIRDISSAVRPATEHEAWVLAKYAAKDRGINSKHERLSEGGNVSAPIPAGTRYWTTCEDGIPGLDPAPKGKGNWVRYQDYAALEAQNEQFRRDLSQWCGLAEIASDDLIRDRLHRIPALKAQVKEALEVKDLALNELVEANRMNYELEAQVRQLREALAPITGEEDRSVQHMYGIDGVAAVNAFLSYRRAALAATEPK